MVRRRSSAARGLTLIELVVVLAVLAAVAAIVAPLMPNILRRAHKSTEATQTVEVAKAVQMYQASYMGYPDNFDLLTDGTTFPSYMPNDGSVATTFGGYATLDSLSTSEAAALHKAGIEHVQTLASNTSGANFHPTLSPYTTTIGGSGQITVTGNTTTKYAVITPTILANNTQFLQSAYNSDSNARYVVLGIGSRSSMVGTVLQDAPTIVPGGKNMTPANSYSRVGVIFKVSGNEINNTGRARFIGAVVLEDDALETTEEGIVGYYEVARDPTVGGAGS